MTRTRLLLAIPLLLGLMAALAACGGDDALSDEEYFRKMDEIDKTLDTRFEEEVFADETATAKDGATTFKSVVDDAEGLYDAVKPPKELEDEHQEIVAAFANFGEKLGPAAERAEDDAPIFALFEDEELVPANERLTAAFCAIQDAADARGIEADVGCDTGDEAVDPSTLPPVETTDVLMEGFAFDPPHIQVSVRDTVTWEQGVDPEPHTATADDDTFDSGNLADEGETFEFTFEEPGEYSYFCELHPEMLGLVTVTE